MQEYLWRLLIDWPRAMGRSPVPAAVGAVRQRIAPALQAMNAATGADAIAPDVVAALEALAAEHVFGEPVDVWLAARRRSRLRRLDRRRRDAAGVAAA